MTGEKKKRIVEVLGLIAQDAESDAMQLDGQPFTGKTVATQLGHVFASIKSLADIVKEVVENETLD